MKKPVAFITGIAGFAGSFLAEELLKHGYLVAGTLYKNEPIDNIKAIRKHLKLYALDVLNEKKCRQLLEKTQPDYIFHLAALASVGQSFEMEKLTYRINFEGTLNILKASLDLKKLKKMVFVSSCDAYGIFKPKTRLLNENQPLNPISPYGISKACAEQLCLYYYHRYGIPVTIARSFNHSGPRQNENFVIPTFARQIALIEAGRQKPTMAVGNLTARRDISDVRDIVGGYRLLAEKGKGGQKYHLCSGQAFTIDNILKNLIKLSTAKIKVKIDINRLRKNDIPVLRGDNRKANQELGYHARYKVKTTLNDTLNYWREKISRQKNRKGPGETL